MKRAYFWLNYLGVIWMINHRVTPLWLCFLVIALAHLFCRGIGLKLLLQFWLVVGLTFLLALITNFSWGLFYSMFLGMSVLELISKMEKE